MLIFYSHIKQFDQIYIIPIVMLQKQLPALPYPRGQARIDREKSGLSIQRVRQPVEKQMQASRNQLIRLVEFRDYRKNLVPLLDQNNTLRQNNQAQTFQISRLEKQKKTLQDHLKNLTQNHKKLEEQVKSERHRQRKRADEYLKIQTQLKSQIESLRKLKDASQRQASLQISKLKAHINQLMSMKKVLEQKYTELEQQKNKLEEAVKEGKKFESNARLKRVKLEQEIKKIAERLEGAETQSSFEQLDLISNHIFGLEQKCSEMERDVYLAFKSSVGENKQSFDFSEQIKAIRRKYQALIQQSEKRAQDLQFFLNEILRMGSNRRQEDQVYGPQLIENVKVFLQCLLANQGEHSQSCLGINQT